MISLLNEEIQVANPAVKAAYRLSLDGHFSSKIFETASNNASWSVRKNAVFSIIKLNDHDSFKTLTKFQNPNYDPEYHETIIAMSNYIELLIKEEKLLESEISVAISLIDHHFHNSKLASHNKELLAHTLNMLQESAK